MRSETDKRLSSLWAFVPFLYFAVAAIAAISWFVIGMSMRAPFFGVVTITDVVFIDVEGNPRLR